MKSVARSVTDGHQKEFIKIFNGLCGKFSRWEIWADFVTLTAIEISNAVDRSHAEKRNETYKTIAGKYATAELEQMSAMLGEIIMGMEENTDQDFLGELFMTLELGNDHAGQFFTPYCVCKMMSAINGEDICGRIENKGWFAVNDCACGAGALLVAFANECREQKVNYQTSVLFVAQDIDYIVGMMCYIQLSLMGCAGFVVIDDTLAHPVTTYGNGIIPLDKGNVWYTPFYFTDIWAGRRMAAKMDMLFHHQIKPVLENVTPKSETHLPKQAESEDVLAINAAKIVTSPPKVKKSEQEPAPGRTLKETRTGQLAFF